MLDITSDTGIPTFVALSRKPDGETEDIIYGAGAHADPRIAALRAICELNQCLTWLPRPGRGDGRPMIDDPLALWWWKTARLGRLPLAGAGGGRAAPRGITLSGDRVDGHARRCGKLPCTRRSHGNGVPGAGSDPARYRHARGAGVIVPGMRHFWARFAPGRLYDVPVGMGCREHPLAEADLNPAPVIA